MDRMALWNKAVDFHGHVCGGLTIGFQAAMYALELLEADPSRDEELVCITENDACGVDAIQSVLGCSVGKGNLLFKLRGKQAFSFFNRRNGKSVRLVLIPGAPQGQGRNLTKEERQQLMFRTPPQELFQVKETVDSLPETARIFQSVICDCCGENTAEHLIRLEGGKKLCLDCFAPYQRFF